MDKMTLVNRNFLKDTRGANLVEYIILVGVIGIRFERTKNGGCQLPDEFARLTERYCELPARDAFKRYELPFHCVQPHSSTAELLSL